MARDVHSQKAIQLSAEDIDYIGRVVDTEVDPQMRKTNPVEYARMVAAVVDTITNRLAAARYGATIKDIVNAKRQFSKITGPARLSPYGSVQNAPKASTATQRIVNEHIAARQAGLPSIVGKSLDYANPNFSDPGPLRDWINPMIEAGAQLFGAGRSIHFHGLAPGNVPAPDTRISGPMGFMPQIDGSVSHSYDIPTPTPKEVGIYGQLADALRSAGVQSLDGKTLGLGPYTAPAGPVERTALPDTRPAAPETNKAFDAIKNIGKALADAEAAKEAHARQTAAATAKEDARTVRVDARPTMTGLVGNVARSRIAMDARPVSTKASVAGDVGVDASARKAVDLGPRRSVPNMPAVASKEATVREYKDYGLTRSLAPIADKPAQPSPSLDRLKAAYRDYAVTRARAPATPVGTPDVRQAPPTAQPQAPTARPTAPPVTEQVTVAPKPVQRPAPTTITVRPSIVQQPVTQTRPAPTMTGLRAAPATGRTFGFGAAAIDAINSGAGRMGDVAYSRSNPDVSYRDMGNGWIDKYNAKYDRHQYSFSGYRAPDRGGGGFFSGLFGGEGRSRSPGNTFSRSQRLG